MSTLCTTYVLGFAFSYRMEKVLLIEKTRPQWQAGFFNGIGGHVEKGESDEFAMVREFQEETGLYTLSTRWEPYVTMRGPGYSVQCFWGIFSSARLGMAKQTTVERPMLCDVRQLPRNVLPNIPMLLAAAHASRYHAEPPFMINYAA